MKSIVFAIGILSVAGHSLQAQLVESRAGPERHQECRGAAALLGTPAALPQEQARAVLSTLRFCDVSGAPALAGAWANPTLRGQALAQLVTVTWEIHDQRILDAVLLLARDEGATEADRFAALSVLATYLDPDHRPSPSRWYLLPGQEWPTSTTRSTHSEAWRPGSQPLQEGSAARILEALTEIETTSSQVRVQRVAQIVRMGYETRIRPRDE
jgi:hypothetical protein